MTPSEITFEAYQEEDGGYYASAVGFAIVTQGDDWDELKYMVEDATLCHFDDGEAPRTIHVNQPGTGLPATTLKVTND